MHRLPHKNSGVVGEERGLRKEVGRRRVEMEGTSLEVGYGKQVSQ